MQSSEESLDLSDGECKDMVMSKESVFLGYCDVEQFDDEDSERSVSPTTKTIDDDSEPTSPTSPIAVKQKRSLEFFASHNSSPANKEETKLDTKKEENNDRKKLRKAFSGSQDSFTTINTLDDLSKFDL